MQRMATGIILVLFICSCDSTQTTQEDANVGPFQEDANGGSLEKQPSTFQRLSVNSPHQGCTGDFEYAPFGSGEFFLKVCDGGDPTVLVAESYTLEPIMGNSATIYRNSYDTRCGLTASQGYNLAIGMGRVVQCHSSDNDVDMLRSGVTYMITGPVDIIGRNHFLAHWPDADASWPDVWAWNVGGQFADSTIGCNEPAALCSGTDVPADYDLCYAIMHRGRSIEIREEGGGSTGCGGIVSWASFMDYPEAKPLGKSLFKGTSDQELVGRAADRLIRFAVAPNTRTAYDWEYATDKYFIPRVSANKPWLSFAPDVTPPIILTSDPISVYGYHTGAGLEFMVEGWRSWQEVHYPFGTGR